MHTLTLDDSGGEQPNHYKIIFSGDQKPEKSTDHGASENPNDTIYKNAQGNWCVQGQANGGRDGWRYGGRRLRHVLEYPDRVQFKVNDRDWQDADEFDVTQRDDWPSESGGKKDKSVVDKLVDVVESIPDLLDSDDYGEVGPHAPARETDRSDWQTVDVRGGDNLGALVDRHGGQTVYQVWDDVDVRDHETVTTLTGDIAIVGKGRSQSTLRLHGNIEALFQFGNRHRSVSDIHIRNLDVDVTDAVVETAIVQGFLDGRGAYIKDLVLRGELRGPADGMVFQTDHSTAVADVERFVARQGADRTERVPSTKDSVGVIMSGPSDGTLRMHECELGGWPNNGVYCSGQVKHGYDGRAVITDHTGFDSDRDQLRVGNDSLILGGTLFADEQKPNFDNLRGVWARYSRGTVIADVTIKTHHTDHGEAVRVDSTAGEVTIRDCDIECRSRHKAARGICAYSPSRAAGDRTDLTVEDTRIHGDGKPNEAVLVQAGREASIDRCEIDVDGVRRKAVDTR